MAIDISGLVFFMPIFSFFFVFLIIFAILAKSQILGESKWINVLISFIMASIFMFFSSNVTYVQTVVPWFVVLLVVVFLVILMTAFVTKDWDKLLNPGLAWVVVVILVIIFLISAIYVFNPVLHPDYGLASGDGPSILSQISSSKVFGGILLIIITAIVAWLITKKN
jgi:hypothetical protein